jgi:adenine-specific DNA-methyltransferase
MTKWGNLAKKEIPAELVGTNRRPLAKAPLHPEASLRSKKSPIAKLEELITLIPDAELQSLVLQEVAKLKTTKKFGLVFEEHRPELVQLPNMSVKVGASLRRKDSTAF